MFYLRQHLSLSLHYHYKIICFPNAVLELILPFMSCCTALLKLWFLFFMLAVDLLIRRGESQGVIHDSLIDEDFNLIWFVNFNCPQTAFSAFSVIQGHGTVKKTGFPWIMESLSSSRINKILLQILIKVCASPWAAEASFNFCYISLFEMQPVVSVLCFAFRQIKSHCV